MTSHNETISIELLASEIDVEVDFDFEPAVAGCYTGLPENCFPDEPEVLEINKLTVGKVDVSWMIEGNELMLVELVKESAMA